MVRWVKLLFNENLARIDTICTSRDQREIGEQNHLYSKEISAISTDRKQSKIGHFLGVWSFKIFIHEFIVYRNETLEFLWVFSLYKVEREDLRVISKSAEYADCEGHF